MTYRAPHTLAAFLVCFPLIVSAEVEHFPSCQTPGAQSVSKHVEYVGDSTVLFRHQERDLVDKTTFVLLHCIDGGSSWKVSDSRYDIHARKARVVLQNAENSSAAYSMRDVVTAMRQQGIPIRRTNLTPENCACWPSVKTASEKARK